MALLKLPAWKISRKTKIILGMVIFLVSVSAIILFFHLTWNSMFEGNDRFILTRLTVISTGGKGWWDGKTEEVVNFLSRSYDENISPLKLEPGKTNLYRIDPRWIRERLETIPEIESASVRRILPDTLEIVVQERMPAAVLGKRKSLLLAAEDSVIIRRSRCLRIADSLPVIHGFSGATPAPGQKFARLEPAMEFLHLTRTAYGEIRILDISIAARDYLVMHLIFKGQNSAVYTVLVPAKDPRNGLDRIISSIYAIRQNGIASREIDLRFDKRSIIKTSEPAK